MTKMRLSDLCLIVFDLVSLVSDFVSFVSLFLCLSHHFTLKTTQWWDANHEISDSYGINDFSFPIQWNQPKSVFSKSEIVYSLRPIPLRICCVSPPSHHRAEYSWLLCSSMTTNFISLRNKLVFNQSRFVRVIYSVSLSCSVLSLIISRTHCHSYSLNCITCHLLCLLVDVSLSIIHSEYDMGNDTNWMGPPEWRIEEKVCLRQC